MPKYKAKRTVFPYVLLYDAAYYSLQEANQIQVGSFFKLMALMLFSTFCLEGYINYLGRSLSQIGIRSNEILGEKKDCRCFCSIYG